MRGERPKISAKKRDEEREGGREREIQRAKRLEHLREARATLHKYIGVRVLVVTCLWFRMTSKEP